MTMMGNKSGFWRLKMFTHKKLCTLKSAKKICHKKHLTYINALYNFYLLNLFPQYFFRHFERVVSLSKNEVGAVSSEWLRLQPKGRLGNTAGGNRILSLVILSRHGLELPGVGWLSCSSRHRGKEGSR